MNALDGNFFATIGRIDQDLEAADRRLTRRQKEIEECMADIDLLRAPTVDVLSRIEYLEDVTISLGFLGLLALLGLFG